MIPDPRTNKLIHDAMIQDELERHGPAPLLRTREPFPVANPLRGIAAKALLGLAHRIDPLPRGSHLPVERGESAAV